jgi:hypothetical protein
VRRNYSCCFVTYGTRRALVLMNNVGSARQAEHVHGMSMWACGHVAVACACDVCVCSLLSISVSVPPLGGSRGEWPVPPGVSVDLFCVRESLVTPVWRRPWRPACLPHAKRLVAIRHLRLRAYAFRRSRTRVAAMTEYILLVTFETLPDAWRGALKLLHQREPARRRRCIMDAR